MNDTTETIFVPGPALSRHAVETWIPMVKRPNPVYMRRVDMPFEVETDAGVLSALPGDFIAHDPISGHFWPVAAGYVAQHYDRADAAPTGGIAPA